MNTPQGSTVHDTIPGANGPAGPEPAIEARFVDEPGVAELAALARDDDAANESAAIAANWVHTRLASVTPETREQLALDLTAVLDGVRRMERMRLGRLLMLSSDDPESTLPPNEELATLARSAELGTLHGRAPIRSQWRFLDVDVIDQMRADGVYAGDLERDSIIRNFYSAADDAPVCLRDDGQQLAVWTGSTEVDRPPAFH